YQSQIIDSLLVPAPGGTGGQLDVVYMANVDGDAADEVLYTQGYTRGVANDTTADLAIVDLMHTPVSVELETDVVPAQFYLDQNYPNPFNPSTQIKFGITEAANVDLRIYDVLGREVAVLINNQYLGAGSYNSNFNAVNLASGIYVYRLTAGTNSVSRKMQLLK
ncbi:MAG: T9SS type A sorting domain-containing protein, partial [Ignavibacteriota bacterium]